MSNTANAITSTQSIKRLYYRLQMWILSLVLWSHLIISVSSHWWRTIQLNLSLTLNMLGYRVHPLIHVGISDTSVYSMSTLERWIINISRCLIIQCNLHMRHNAPMVGVILFLRQTEIYQLYEAIWETNNTRDKQTDIYKRECRHPNYGTKTLTS